MTRTTLIIGALIFALAAAGVLVWTGVIDPSKTTSTASAPPAEATTSLPPATLTREAQLVNDMSAAAAGGGFVATFSETDAPKWTLAQGTRLERFALEGGNTVFARLSSAAAVEATPRLDGVYVELPKEFAATSAGRKIEIGVVARAARSNPAEDFAIVYFTRKMGNSGWLSTDLAPEFQLKIFEYDVPAPEDGYPEGPVVAIRGASAGGDKGVEMLGVYVRLKQ